MLITHSPSHETISRRAREIWIAKGNPSGQDTAIWLSAERQLTLELPEASAIDPPESYASFNPFGHRLGTAKAETGAGGLTIQDPLETAAKSAQLKHAAATPRLPTHPNAPRHTPPESGKPLWHHPRSS